MTGEIRSNNGYGISNKAEFQESQFDVGIELGLKLQEGEEEDQKKHHNDGLPSLCSNQINGGGDADDNRPNSSELGTPYLIDSGICDVLASGGSTTTSVAAVSAAAAGNGVSAPSAVRSCLLQTFDISSPPAAAYPLFKSPGGGAAAGGMATATTLGFCPFTAAQWKELQRQAMIFKYMVASIPVPPDLLFPINTTLSELPTSTSSWGKMGMIDLRWEGHSKDAEPGRCKRTDGKKWRCSRDVAPNQKYCERHLNRGRPRSRKPVEIHADFSVNHHPNNISSAKKTRLGGEAQNSSINLQSLKTDINGSTFDKAHCVGIGSSVHEFNRNHETEASSFEHMVSAPPPCEQPRSLDWVIRDEGESMAANEQQWQQVGLKTLGLATNGSFCGTNASVFQPHFQDEHLNLNTFVSFNSNQPNSDDQNYCIFPNSATPRGFIDAWSNHDDGAGNKSSVPSNEKVSPSSLALSMAGTNLIDEEMCQIQMGLGVSDSDSSHGDGLKSQVSGWLGPPSWVTSNPGGPLAEVLRPRSTAVTNLATHSSCPDAGNGNLVAPPETAASSPSGVFHRSLASFSDSSSNNIPICDTTKAKPEVPFQWLS
ncbi:hypothetical protein Ancab_010076 [Ancistrocladus abbreviatus]